MSLIHSDRILSPFKVNTNNSFQYCQYQECLTIIMPRCSSLKLICPRVFLREICKFRRLCISLICHRVCSLHTQVFGFQPCTVFHLFNLAKIDKTFKFKNPLNLRKSDAPFIGRKNSRNKDRSDITFCMTLLLLS